MEEKDAAALVKLLDDLQHEHSTTTVDAVAIHWVACRVYESHDRASDMLVVVHTTESRILKD